MGWRQVSVFKLISSIETFQYHPVNQSYFLPVTSLVGARNPYWRGRLSKVDLLELTSLDQLLLRMQTLFTVTKRLFNEEVNRTEPFPLSKASLVGVLMKYCLTLNFFCYSVSTSLLGSRLSYFNPDKTVACFCRHVVIWFLSTFWKFYFVKKC